MPTHKCQTLAIEALPRLPHIKPPQWQCDGSYLYRHKRGWKTKCNASIATIVGSLGQALLEAHRLAPVMAVLAPEPTALAVPAPEVVRCARLQSPCAAGVVGSKGAGPLLGALRWADRLVAGAGEVAIRLRRVLLVCWQWLGCRSRSNSEVDGAARQLEHDPAADDAAAHASAGRPAGGQRQEQRRDRASNCDAVGAALPHRSWVPALQMRVTMGRATDLHKTR